MDTFELEWSINRVTYSKAYIEAGKPLSMHTKQHVKNRLIKKKDIHQPLAEFIAEADELKQNTTQDIRLWARFVINGKYLDQMIRFAHVPDSTQPYLLPGGYESVIETIERHQSYGWASFFISQSLGKSFTLEDMYDWFDQQDKEWVEAIYQEEIDAGTQLYGCVCGGRGCGGYEVHISRQGQDIVWDWRTYKDWKLPFTFRFDAQAYEQAWLEYQAYVAAKLKMLQVEGYD